MEDNKIKLFEDRKVRTEWNEMKAADGKMRLTDGCCKYKKFTSYHTIYPLS